MTPYPGYAVRRYLCRSCAVFLPGDSYTLPGPRFGALFAPFVGPRKRSAAGQGQRARSQFCAGWRLRLTRPTGFVRPVVNIFTMVAETTGVGGLKIAETFPEGRGSPHGCGLRAVFCTDAASARPEACRDKSKVPRSGDFAGRSPGVQGAAATGRPLCAPCAMIDITQKTNRERKLR